MPTVRMIYFNNPFVITTTYSALVFFRATRLQQFLGTSSPAADSNPVDGTVGSR